MRGLQGAGGPLPAYHAAVDDRRRLGALLEPVRVLIVTIALASTVGACGFIGGTVVQDGPPVPAGPLGPVVPGRDGGPPVECRGIPMAQCQDFGCCAEAGVVRVIVTCTGVCTPLKGEVRIDAVQPNGTTRSMGQGAYESAAAEPAPPVMPEPAMSPRPS